MTAIMDARQTVAAPVRKPRRFGIFSVVDVVDGGDQHWLFGGLTADGEECSSPSYAAINCGPTIPEKSMRSWYSNLEGDAWLAYMFDTCQAVGRYSEAQAKLRERFLASEQSAVEAAFQDNVLGASQSAGAYETVSLAIGALEAYAARIYGGQIILHLPFTVAEEAATKGMFERVGDHIETVAGNLVSIGNYRNASDGGTLDTPILYATGAVTLYRGDLVTPDISMGSAPGGASTNDYYALIERGYAAVVDCFMASATTKMCSCAEAGPPVLIPYTLTPGNGVDLAIVGVKSCEDAVTYLNDGNWPADPDDEGAWPPGFVITVAIDDPGSPCTLTWDGSAWAQVIV